MSEPQSNSQLLIYRSEDGRIKLDVRFEGETVWLTQPALKLATWSAQSQPRRGDIFVENATNETKLRRSDIIPFMSPLRGLGVSARYFYKDFTPTEFAMKPDVLKP